MFISIRNIGNRYAYVIGDSVADHPNCFFCSSRDFYLSGEVKSLYDSFGDAHAAGSWLIAERSSHIMAKKASYYKLADEGPEINLLTPENVMVSHYGEQIELISQRFLGLGTEKNTKIKEEAKVIRAEVESLAKDVLNLKDLLEEVENDRKLDKILNTARTIQKEIDEKFGKELLQPQQQPTQPPLPMPPMGAKASADPETKINGSEFIKHFAYVAMKALQPVHEDIYIRLVEYDKSTDSYIVYLAEPEDGEKDVVLLRFDSDFCLTDIYPSKETQFMAPYHSVEFFERYWEPIVIAIGHIRVPGLNIIAVPSMNQEERLKWESFEEDNSQKSVVTISLDNHGWKMSKPVKKEASSITEGDLKPGTTDVKCINTEHDAYYGRTGKVTSVAPSSGLFLVRVDFGRGLGSVWMKIEDLEKVIFQG